jgi:hypothetical protein
VGWPLAIYMIADTGDTMQLIFYPPLISHLQGTLDSLALGDSVVAGGITHGFTVEPNYLRRIQP